MVRNYVRKSERRDLDQKNLKMAISSIKNGTSTSSASRVYGIPRTTLQYWMSRDIPDTSHHSSGRFKTVFSEAMEDELGQYLIKVQKPFCGLSAIDVRRLAYEFAESKNLTHSFNTETKLAGTDWLASFMKRQGNLSLRKPEATKQEVDGLAFESLSEDELKNDFNADVGPRKKASFSSLKRLNDNPSYGLKFSVVDTLAEHRDGARLLGKLKQDKMLKNEDRCAMTRILVAALINTEGNYPDTHIKKCLAEAIVTAFPCLGCKSNTTGGLDSRHYFDELTGTGFIANRFKTLRKTLTPAKKKYQKSKTNLAGPKDVSCGVEESDDDSIKEKITLMQFMSPVDSSKCDIINFMEATFQTRRDYITKESPTVTEIVAKYPRLIDFDGELIAKEFKQIEAEAENSFLSKFPTIYAPRLLKYTEKFKPLIYQATTTIADENLRAVVCLSALLPPSNTMIKNSAKKLKTSIKQPPSLRERAIIPERCLVQFVEPGTDIQQFIRSRPDDLLQPFVICVGTAEEGGEFFVLCDKFKIAVGKCPVQAIDKLFKTFFVFNVAYPETLHRFYNFLETRVYSLNSKSRNLSATAGLDATLLNMLM